METTKKPAFAPELWYVTPLPDTLTVCENTSNVAAEVMGVDELNVFCMDSSGASV